MRPIPLRNTTNQFGDENRPSQSGFSFHSFPDKLVEGQVDHGLTVHVEKIAEGNKFFQRKMFRMRYQPGQPVIICSQVIGHNASRNMIENVAEFSYVSRLNQKFNGVVSAIFSHSQRNVYSQVILQATYEIFYFTDKHPTHHIHIISILCIGCNCYQQVPYQIFLTPKILV